MSASFHECQRRQQFNVVHILTLLDKKVSSVAGKEWVRPGHMVPAASSVANARLLAVRRYLPVSEC